MPSLSGVRPHRLLIALLTLLLALPVTQLLVPSPAHADPGIATGYVVDGLGEPVGGVTVRALTAPAYTSGPSTTTATEGDYGLALAAGTYHLTYAKSGYATATYGGTTDPSEVVVDAAGAITVDGEPVEDNLLDDVELASTQTHPVSGLVKSSTAPLSGIRVSAYPVSDPETATATATTTADGHYTLQLPLGRYNLSYVDTASTYVTTWYGGAEPGSDVSVLANGTVQVDDAASGCASLCDVTMTAAPSNAEWPITGDVVDGNGDPVSGVAVSVAGTGSSTDSGTGMTDADGLYSVSVLPGTYRVSFARSGFVSAPYTGNGGSGQATITVAANGTLSVAPAEELSGNQLSTTLLVSNPYAVTGRVVKASAPTQPIAGITVRAYPEGDHTTTVTTATTAANGTYSLSLPIGGYDLQYVDEVADGTDYVSTFLGGATASPITVGQGGTLSYAGATVTAAPDVAMSVPAADATYAVTGSVLDAIGEPIAGIGVTATPTSGAPVATTSGSDGGYTLSLKAGSYRVTFAENTDFQGATLTGSGTAPATVTVAANGVIRVDGVEAVGGTLDAVSLVGKRTYPLTGRVTNGTSPLAGIAVKVYAEGITTSGTEVATLTTGSTGGFTATLPIGSYVLQFSGSSGGVLYESRWYGAVAPPGTAVQVGQGGVVSVDYVPGALADVVMSAVTPDSAYPLLGSVVDANFESLPGVTVTALAISGGAVQAEDVSDADGMVELGLKPGTYEVRYAKSGYDEAFYADPDGDDPAVHARILVKADGTMSIAGTPMTEGLYPQVLLSTTTHPVTGTVVDGTGAGIGGITVEAIVLGESTPAATATTTASGAYTLALPVQTYTIRFTDNVVAAPTYAVTYLGGSTAATAAFVKVATGGAVTVNEVAVVGSLAAVTMTAVGADVTYELAGIVSDPDFEPLAGATVEVQPTGSTPATHAVTGLSAADGSFALQVRPGTYRIRFSKDGYVATYLLTEDGSAQPSVVTVAPNGTLSASGITDLAASLSAVFLAYPAPVLVTAPRLTGRVAVGQTISTTLGTWTPDVSNLDEYDYYVDWFVAGKLDGVNTSGVRNERFTIPLSAVGKKITYRLSVYDVGGLAAPGVYDSPGVVVPQVASSMKTALKTTGKGTKKKRTLTVTIKVPGVPKPTGAITVLDGKKKLVKAKLVAGKKGVAVIKLPKLKPGKHTLKVVYAGTPQVKGVSKTVKLKV